MAEVLRDIGMTTRALDSISNIEFKEVNLTREQYLYLVRICENPGIIQEKLVEMIKVDRTTAARAIKRLESNGVTEHLEDGENKKIKKLCPTEKEAEICPFIIRENNYSNAVVLNGLSDEKAKQLEYLLNKVYKNVSGDWNLIKKGNKRICWKGEAANKHEIRKMTPSDVDLLQQISIETFTGTFGKDSSPEHLTDYLTQAYTLEKLTEELKDRGTDFFLVSIDQEPTGCLEPNTETSQSEEVANHFLEIERIYVRKKFKHQGIGTFLLGTATEKAKEKQRTAVWFDVWEHNDVALTFYRKKGFIKHSEHVFYMGDDPQADYLFIKQLF